jgi:RNA polymerase-binding transcription factor DksA
MRFDDATLARLRKPMMSRGHALATLLAEVLAGKGKPSALAALGLDDRPGLRPEERLRLALDQVEARRRLLDAGDDRHGRCDVCGDDLGLAALEEMPWADRCRAHAA